MRLFSIDFEDGNVVNNLLGRDVEVLKISKFRDGEKMIHVPDNLKDEKICLLCDLSNENRLFVSLLAVNAFKNSGVKEINLIVPYLCYMRQDRLFKNQPISLQVVSNFLNNSGASNIYIIEVHSDKILNFCKLNTKNISLMNYMSEEMDKRIDFFSKEYVLVAPDYGSLSRVKSFNEYLNLPIVVCSKFRNKDNLCIINVEFGDVLNKNCLIVDDILDSGSTLLNTCLSLKDKGAKNINIVVAHSLFSENALDKFQEFHNKGIVEKIYVSNTIEKDYSQYSFVEVISISKFLFDLVNSIEKDE